MHKEYMGLTYRVSGLLEMGRGYPFQEFKKGGTLLTIYLKALKNQEYIKGTGSAKVYFHVKNKE
jgi:hypothetical protein